MQGLWLSDSKRRSRRASLPSFAQGHPKGTVDVNPEPFLAFLLITVALIVTPAQR